MTVYAIYTKKHGVNPKTGDSNKLPITLTALGFAIVGLRIIMKKKGMEENNK